MKALYNEDVKCRDCHFISGTKLKNKKEDIP